MSVRRSRPASATSRDHAIASPYFGTPSALSSSGGGGGGLLSLSPSHAQLLALNGKGGFGGSGNSSSGSSTGRPRDRDAEQLSSEVRMLKENGNASARENAFLKAQLQRLVAQLRKKDRQIEQLVDMKMSAVSDAAADAILVGQMRELRAELSTLARLSDKCRELEQGLQRKDEEIRRLKAAPRFTAQAELETEALTYMKEAARMRKAVLALQQQNGALQSQMEVLQQTNAQQAAAFQHAQKQQQQQQQQQFPSFASPATNRFATPSRGSASHVTSPLSSGVAVAALSDSSDTLMLKQELLSLRAENLRLRSEAVHAAAARAADPATSARTGARTAAQVLHDLADLQAELAEQIAEDELSAAAAEDHWADSAEYVKNDDSDRQSLASDRYSDAYDSAPSTARGAAAPSAHPQSAAAPAAPHATADHDEAGYDEPSYDDEQEAMAHEQQHGDGGGDDGAALAESSDGIEEEF